MPRSKVELFAAIRRDSRVEGLSVRGLARKYGVHRRTVREALSSAWPRPRKKLPPRRSRLDPFKHVTAEPSLNLASFRRTNVQVSLSSLYFHDFASPGRRCTPGQAFDGWVGDAATAYVTYTTQQAVGVESDERFDHRDAQQEGSHRQWDGDEDGCLLDERRLSWTKLQQRMASPNFRTVFQQEDADPESRLVQGAWIEGGVERRGQPLASGRDARDRDRIRGIGFALGGGALALTMREERGHFIDLLVGVDQMPGQSGAEAARALDADDPVAILRLAPSQQAVVSTCIVGKLPNTHHAPELVERRRDS